MSGSRTKALRKEARKLMGWRYKPRFRRFKKESRRG
jgi:hypothetical protein